MWIGLTTSSTKAESEKLHSHSFANYTNSTEKFERSSRSLWITPTILRAQPTSASIAQLKGGAGAVAFVATAATAQQICCASAAEERRTLRCPGLAWPSLCSWRAQRRAALGRAPSSGHPAYAGFALSGVAVPSRASPVLLGPCPATPSPPGAPSSAPAGAGLEPYMWAPCKNRASPGRRCRALPACLHRLARLRLSRLNLGRAPPEWAPGLRPVGRGSSLPCIARLRPGDALAALRTFGRTG